VPWLRRMVTELWLVSEKSSSGSGAMTFLITPPGDAAYRWYSRAREEGGEHRRHEVQREGRAAYAPSDTTSLVTHPCTLRKWTSKSWSL
jgi:hypothetical protein